MTNFSKVLLISVAIGLPTLSSAGNTTVYIPLIQGMFNVEKDGANDVIFQQVEEEGGFVWTLEYVPFNRAITLFEHDPEGCIGIGNKKSAADYFGIEAIDIGFGYSVTNIVFASRKNEAPVGSFKQLFGKRIVHLSGEAPEQYGFDIPTLETTAVTSHSQSVKMLLNNRVDVIFAATGDLSPFDDVIHYDPDFIVLSTYETLTCKDTPANQALIKQFGEMLKALELVAD